MSNPVYGIPPLLPTDQPGTDPDTAWPADANEAMIQAIGLMSFIHLLAAYDVTKSGGDANTEAEISWALNRLNALNSKYTLADPVKSAVSTLLADLPPSSTPTAANENKYISYWTGGDQTTNPFALCFDWFTKNAPSWGQTPPADPLTIMMMNFSFVDIYSNANFKWAQPYVDPIWSSSSGEESFATLSAEGLDAFVKAYDPNGTNGLGTVIQEILPTDTTGDGYSQFVSLYDKTWSTWTPAPWSNAWDECAQYAFKLGNIYP